MDDVFIEIKDTTPILSITKKGLADLPKKQWLKLEGYMRVLDNAICLKSFTILDTNKVEFEDAKYVIENLKN